LNSKKRDEKWILKNDKLVGCKHITLVHLGVYMIRSPASFMIDSCATNITVPWCIEEILRKSN